MMKKPAYLMCKAAGFFAVWKVSHQGWSPGKAAHGAGRGGVYRSNHGSIKSPEHS